MNKYQSSLEHIPRTLAQHVKLAQRLVTITCTQKVGVLPHI